MEQSELFDDRERKEEQLELNFREHFDSSFLLTVDTTNLINQHINSTAVTFHDCKSGKTGKLDWTGGVFRFEGAAEASALIFFTHMLQNIDHKAKRFEDALKKYNGVKDRNGICSADLTLNLK